MPEDIVCKRPVPETTEFHSTYGDRPYYFCSKKCQLDFAENPIKYVDPSQTVASTEGSPVVGKDGKVRPNTV